MTLLASNFPPVRTNYQTYRDKFLELFTVADIANIATGYVSEESLVDLNSLLTINNGPYLNLHVGMHLFDGVTQKQLFALQALNVTLTERSLGRITVSQTFPFHGKISSFVKNGVTFGALLGSSNLSNLVAGNHRQYEVDHLFESGHIADEIHQLIERLVQSTSIDFSSANFEILTKTDLQLSHHDGVEKVELPLVAEMVENIEYGFNIPLKGDEAPKSNLNTFKGKGRVNQQGYEIPRSWYEVELIVPKSVTDNVQYPQSDREGEGGTFSVVTDDGWSFKCKVSGDFSKNLRSEGDLKILGKWLKGRLENAGALQPGELVTDATLQRYGRSSIGFSKVRGSDKWLMDFSV